MPWFEGVDNEVLIVLAILFICFAFLLISTVHNVYRYFEDRALTEEEIAERPRVHNENTCPICLSPPTLPVETNCGHLYCGYCLQALRPQNSWICISCPMCRTQVNLLFTCFTSEELSYESGDELTRREAITAFTREYNRVHSTNRSFLSKLWDIPVLMRHYISDVWNGNIRLEEEPFLNVRMYLLFILCNLYVIMPTDLIPETVFGFLGLLDDILLCIIIIIYLSSVYRQHVIG